MILLLIILLLLPSYSQANVRDGLVGWWKLDETSGAAIDSSKFGNNGTSNGTTYNTNCVRNNCRSFNGSTDSITASDNAALDPTQAITLSVWVKRNRTGAREIFFDKGTFNGSNDGQYWVEFQGDDTVRFLIYLGSSFSTDQVITASSFNKTGVWYHIVATYDRITMRTYVNGVADANTTAETDSIRSTALEFCLGNRGGSHDIPLNGYLDDVRMYNRALTPQEVLDLYNQGMIIRGNGTKLNGTGSKFNY